MPLPISFKPLESLVSLDEMVKQVPDGSGLFGVAADRRLVYNPAESPKQ